MSNQFNSKFSLSLPMSFSLMLVLSSCQILGQNDEATYNRAAKLLDEAKYHEALKLYDTLISYNSKDVEALHKRGETYYYLDSISLAINDFRFCIALDSNDAWSYHALGVVETRNSERMKYYNKAIELKPNYGRAFYNRASLKEELGDLVGAIEDMTLCITYLETGYHRVKPIEAYVRRAELLEEFQKYDRAIIDYEKALTYEPKNTSILYELGRLYIEKPLSNHEKGCRLLSKAGELGAMHAYDLIKRHCNK